MADAIREIIERHARPLEPRPTGVSPDVSPQAGVRAVLFDVYGTLLISGSGDIGVASAAAKPEAVNESLRAVGLPAADDPAAVVTLLEDAIRQEHARLREQGVDYPEVRIEEMWHRVRPDADAERLAIEYEMRVNPVWPMPGMTDTLDTLRDRGVRLGIVSNAQAFTRELFPPLCGRSVNELGFEEDLCVWSYAHRRAKPGTFLYERAAARLAEQGIPPGEVLYVGNDMRNDVWPASRVGFRTVLFAGDARSLRWRTDDADVAGVRPDAVITELSQIIGLLAS